MKKIIFFGLSVMLVSFLATQTVQGQTTTPSPTTAVTPTTGTTPTTTATPSSSQSVLGATITPTPKVPSGAPATGLY